MNSSPAPAPLRNLRLILWGLIALILLVLAIAFGWQSIGGSAGDPRHQSIDITGKTIGAPLNLTDQDGKPRSDASLMGKYRLVYFGYTYCPDICPTDVQKLGLVMRKLDGSDPALSAKLQPIFVTIDPERDTPAVVKQFVGAFHPRLIGLTGTLPQIGAVAKGYAAYFAKMPPAQPGGAYLMDHSAMVYLMGTRGEPLIILSREMTVDEMIAEIRKWVK